MGSVGFFSPLSFLAKREEKERDVGWRASL